MSFHIPIPRRHAQALRMKRQVAFEPTATYEIGDGVPTPGQEEPAPSAIVPSQPPPLVFPSGDTPQPSPPAEGQPQQPHQPQTSDSVAPSQSQPSAQPSTPTPGAPVQTPSESQSSPTPAISQPSANNVPTPIKDTTIFSTVKVTSSAASASASVSASPEATGGNKTGMIVGGIGAAAIAAVGIIFAITYFIRRFRKSKDVDENMFDPHDFRRSAVLLGDNDPYKPRPPTMIENRASPAPTFGTKYGSPPPAAYMQDSYSFGMYDSGPYPSFGPGQYVNSPVTATSARAMMNEPPRMPDPSYDDQSQYLVRYPSVSEQHLATPVTVHRQPSVTSNTVPADDYVDLSRSSVSPFQAAQYAEISRQLNTDVPKGLDTPAATHFIGSEKPVLQTVGEVNEEDEQPKMPQSQASSPFDDRLDEELEFPAPPEMGTRIDSMPPILPEIHVRNGSYDFPSSIRGSSIDSTTGNDMTGPAVPYGQKFTLTPSPLASSTGLVPEPDTESVKASSPPAAPVTPAPLAETPATAPKPAGEEPKKRPDTVYTIYDPDDAYGGI